MNEKQTEQLNGRDNTPVLRCRMCGWPFSPDPTVNQCYCGAASYAKWLKEQETSKYDA